MKKKHIILGASLLSALVAGLCPFIAEAKTETVDENALVFNANDLNSGKNYSQNTKIDSNNGVTLSTGKRNSAKVSKTNAEYSDYTFTKGLYSYGSSNPSYSITASKGTTLGVYYTLENSSSSSAKLEIVNEYYILGIFGLNVIPYHTTLNKYEVSTNSMNYLEYTFTQETVGLRSANQGFWLYGLTVVSSEEITNRTNAEDAITNLINYYNANGASLSNEFEALVDKANEAIKSVNNLSQVSNYSEYENIVSEYKELVEDNTKAN